ncbi:hypothetical protein ARMSODRAFT_889286, partial [Armillaria solidipes]
TNSEKGDVFRTAFFLPKPTISAVPQNMQYPLPAWEFRLITNEQVEQAFKQMKLLKATKLGTISNSVLVHCADLLVPHIGPIYQATFTQEEYLDRLSMTNTIILCKSGKLDYENLNSYCPIILSDGWGRETTHYP